MALRNDSTTLVPARVGTAPQGALAPLSRVVQAASIEAVAKFNCLFVMAGEWQGKRGTIGPRRWNTRIMSLESFADPLEGTPPPSADLFNSRFPDPSGIALIDRELTDPQASVFAEALIPESRWTDIDSNVLFNDSDYYWEIAIRDPFSAYDTFNLGFLADTASISTAYPRGQGFYQYSHFRPSQWGETLRIQCCNPIWIGQDPPSRASRVIVGGTLRQPVVTPQAPLFVGSLRLRKSIDRPAYRAVDTRQTVVPLVLPVPFAPVGSVCIVNAGAPLHEPLPALARRVMLQNVGTAPLRVGTYGSINATNGHLLTTGQQMAFETYRADSLGVACDVAAVGDGALAFTIES